MSQKWIRSKKWDDEHIPGSLWPVKFVLRMFSSIPLAVVLLTCVALYGALASVPVGLIALAPTLLIYGLTALVAVVLVSVLPTYVSARVMRGVGVGPGARFAAGLGLGLVLFVGAVWAWYSLVWPALKYDALTGKGLRLFPGFVEANKSVTVRRLRGMEMSELEFYGWWPLRVVLLMFVVNLVTATVRRIEFTFRNIGVLTVHSGIVTIAVGSMWYSSLKEEGDMVLQSGQPDARGMASVGPGESAFYDNTTVALWANMGRRWEMRPLRGVPRYNDYNLDAAGVGRLADGSGATMGEYTLNVPVPDGPAPGVSGVANVDADVKMRVVGYASYADLESQWVRPGTVAAANGRAKGSPTWWVRVSASAMGLERRLPFWTAQARGRVLSMGGVLGVEFTRGMPAQRWQDLQAELPAGAAHGLVLEAGGERKVVGVEAGTKAQIGGYEVEVEQLLAQPPFPIITPGYEGSQSSVAIVRVTPPAGKGVSFERYVYHRFPEINQDMLAEVNERGMPKRRDADPAIRIGYVDASVSQVYFDEVFGSEREAGGPVVRAIMRPRGGAAKVTEGMKAGSSLPIGASITMELAERWEDAVELETPVPVDAARRDNKDLGTHRHAAIAVEVSAKADGEDVKRVVWLPFAQYVFKELDQSRVVALPDGRQVVLAFGRMMRQLPGLELQLVDFQMIPHPFGGPTQDFKSELLVHRETAEGVETQESLTSLNDPLLVHVPFREKDGVPWIANMMGRAVSVVAPTQYKFSQAGWDAQGWTQTQQEAEAGLRPRAVARWTILGVGNNPGIFVIAAGAVMMGVGIPWAFYVKPLLVRREKRKIQRQLAQAARERGEKKTAGEGTSEPEAVGAQT